MDVLLAGGMETLTAHIVAHYEFFHHIELTHPCPGINGAVLQVITSF